MSTSLKAEVIMPGRQPCPGLVSDISASGSLFRWSNPPQAQPGMHGVLSVTDPAAKFDAVVRVARVAEPGSSLGLQFLSPSGATRAVIARLTSVRT